jgi:hypothetical protein
VISETNSGALVDGDGGNMAHRISVRLRGRGGDDVAPGVVFGSGHCPHTSLLCPRFKMANEGARSPHHKSQSPFAFNKPNRLAAESVLWRLSLWLVQIHRFDGSNRSFTPECSNRTVAATEDCNRLTIVRWPFRAFPRSFLECGKGSSSKQLSSPFGSTQPLGGRSASLSPKTK